jgi:RNA polymerase sigma-70 factor (ECF subfamily)
MGPPFSFLPQIRRTGAGVSSARAKHGAGFDRKTGVSAVLARAPQMTVLRPGPEDGELVATALGGDSGAFALLVERYDRAVYHLAYRTLHDVEEARDVAQEAFFKAYRSLHTFKPGAKFSTWIFAITYHACCDRLNRSKRYSGSEMPDRADPGPGPESQAIALDQARRLRDAIDTLPEKYRTVITLYHLQGKQYEEIATVLGLPMGTVKTHLFRAKEHLRKLLSAQEVME